MTTSNFQQFLKLVRFNYSLFSAFGVFLSGVLAGDLYGLQLEYLVAFLVVFLSGVSLFAFNDYFDFEVDKLNDRYDRPLVSGVFSRRVALLVGFSALSLVALLLLFLNFLAQLIVVTSVPLFFLYSLGLKKVLLVKNILVAYAYVATILFASVVADAVLEPLIIYFALMGFIVGLAFEIMLDIADVEGDKELAIGSLAARFGVGDAAKISVSLYAMIMVLDPLPFITLIDPRLHLDYAFLCLICIPVISYFFISRALLKDQSKGSIFQLKSKVFMIMQIGSLAYLVGVLF